MEGNEGVVDSCFSDDYTGCCAEHAGVMKRTGISRDKAQALQVATQQVWTRALEKLIGKNGYNWQAFGSEDFTAKLLPSKVIRLGMA